MKLIKFIHSFLWISLCALILAISATATLTAGAEEVAVVVNLKNSIEKMTPEQVSDIFLGRHRTFPSGDPVLVLERERNSPLRKKFFQSLNGMSLRRLNAYWARLQFSGEVQPPPTLGNSRDILQAVRKNPNAIGYVDAAIVDDSVRVVLILKDRKNQKKIVLKSKI